MKKDHRANCRVSMPVLHLDQHTLSFNGFAWSNNMGMIHETAPIAKETWKQWLGTQQ